MAGYAYTSMSRLSQWRFSNFARWSAAIYFYDENKTCTHTHKHARVEHLKQASDIRRQQQNSTVNIKLKKHQE